MKYYARNEAGWLKIKEHYGEVVDSLANLGFGRSAFRDLSESLNTLFLNAGGGDPLSKTTHEIVLKRKLQNKWDVVLKTLTHGKTVYKKTISGFFDLPSIFHDDEVVAWLKFGPGDDVPSDSSRSLIRKNTISFSSHCENIGVPLANIFDRWCSISDSKRVALFNVWANKLEDGRYVFMRREKFGVDTRVGAKEMFRIINTVLEKGYDAYGILAEPIDKDGKRKRGYFEEKTLLVLRFAEEPIGYVAYVVGEVSVGDVLAGKKQNIYPFPSSLDDLDIPPGVVSPVQVKGGSFGYRRNDAVRQYVLERAKGKCEHCNEPGFLLPNGKNYLEAHHVIALSAAGPDTVHNVIALCAEHHREAHYGADAAVLQVKFLEKLAAINT
ncbi:HNH endonuclease signature motif containing protein [Vogesella sp. GCM10023246]|uniref:HNH endonuclease signature motif containing protein n=1 Tax=Vogesella oryzagri TaxID=3160864 RepID=A0ABV1M7J5_9NEIS